MAASGSGRAVRATGIELVGLTGSLSFAARETSAAGDPNRRACIAIADRNQFTGAREASPVSRTAASYGIGVSGDHRMPASRPNILFIVVDDCGYADLGCTGQTDYRTPALDQLAAEGIRFTQAYANSALCTNTRVALITGRYQYRLPIGLVEPLRWSDRQAPEMGVPPGFPTLPALLRGAGYRLSGNGISDICRATAR